MTVQKHDILSTSPSHKGDKLATLLTSLKTGVLLSAAVLNPRDGDAYTLAMKNGTEPSVQEAKAEQKDIQHETLIKTPLETIIKVNGKEKGMELIKEHLLLELNIQRKKLGAGPLIANNVLNKIAQEHAEDMRNNNYFDHTDSQGQHVRDRAYNVGYNYSKIKENIAKDNTIQGAISGFVGSRIGNHEIILSPEFQDIGFGIATFEEQGKKTAYLVFDFAAPAK